MRPVLREYQLQDVEGVREQIRAGHRCVVLVLNTGGGKTVEACEIIRAAKAKGRKVFFVAHRRELVLQCSAKLDEFDVPHGIIMGAHKRRRPHEDVHVCSVQTLVRREGHAVPDIIFVDECHRAMARTYRKILDLYPSAVVIGLTATPVRADGKGLGDLFTSMVLSLDAAALTDMGFLVPTRVFAPSVPDMSKVKLAGADYDKAQAEKVMMESRLVGDVVSHWLRLGRDRQTVCFATTVRHSKSLVERFVAAGIRAEHLDGDTPTAERDSILARLKDGRLELVSNCGVLTEGWDCPPVSCVILARPTRSEGLYLQMVGRVRRPWGNKTDCLILDHAGCAHVHGLPDDDREWSLEHGLQKKGRGKKSKKPGVRICPDCYMAFSTKEPRCPNCGKDVARAIMKEQEGELEEVKVVRKPHPVLTKLDAIRQSLGYKKGWNWYTWSNLKRMTPQARQKAIQELEAKALSQKSSTTSSLSS